MLTLVPGKCQRSHETWASVSATVSMRCDLLLGSSDTSTPTVVRGVTPADATGHGSWHEGLLTFDALALAVAYQVAYFPASSWNSGFLRGSSHPRCASAHTAYSFSIFLREGRVDGKPGFWLISPRTSGREASSLPVLQLPEVPHATTDL